MIKSFKHKGLEAFFRVGNKAGVRPDHAEKLRKQLFALDLSKTPEDMKAPGWRLHKLSGKPILWSVTVNGNWRIVFKFDGNNDAQHVDYLDYH